MRAYLDHAASTPVRPEALAAMLPVLEGEAGNPSGAHRSARAARRVIDEAREVVAEALGARPTEVVFTSGGTEADSLAVLGVHDRRGGVVVCGATEHHAVLDGVVARGGCTAPVRPDGVIDLDGLAATLDDLAAAGRSVNLVSVMAVNNEVGVVQPVPDVVEVVHRHAPGALVHTDAVQAVPWLDVAGHAAGCDLVSISAHKFGGPKGAGALVVRGEAAAALAPRLLGGGQERGLRPGTQNVPGIVGLGAALAATLDRRDEEVVRVRGLRDRMAAGLVGGVPGLVLTAAGGRTSLEEVSVVPGICHVCIAGLESEALLYVLDAEGLDASSASSCSSGGLGTSHVLEAMGVAPELAGGSLRLSLGWSSTGADVDAALTLVPEVAARLSRFTPAGTS